MNKISTKKQTNGRTATRKARRQQLINATIDSISKNGFSGTTLASVTKGAKLSHGIVNFHFKSKEALYEHTLGFLAQEHHKRWSTALEKASSQPEKQLAAIVEVDFERNICSPKKLAVWYAFFGQAKHRPSYLKIHNKFDMERDEIIERLCAQIVKDGDYDHIDAVSTTRNLIALIDGHWLNLLLYPKLADRKQARDDCFAFLANAFPKHFPRFS